MLEMLHGSNEQVTNMWRTYLMINLVQGPTN